MIGRVNVGLRSMTADLVYLIRSSCVSPVERAFLWNVKVCFSSTNSMTCKWQIVHLKKYNFLIPGHFGHIVLTNAVYHPNYVSQIVKILNRLCLSCLSLKVKMVKYFKLDIKLIPILCNKFTLKIGNVFYLFS